MSKYGYNEKELRKTIITKIDKDGFHNRTVTYGKDSGGSQSGDFSRATVTIHNESGYSFYYCCPHLNGDEDESMVPYLNVSKLGPFEKNSNVSFRTVLYKNMLKLPMAVMLSFADGLTPLASFNSICELLGSGNIRIRDDQITITGDCVITIKDKDGGLS